MVRGYSENQVREMGFPRADYSFPKEPGEGSGTLVMKMWGNKCLICYFDMDDGSKIKLSLFREHETDRHFFPENSEIDFTEVEIGSQMEIAYGITRTGKAKFLTADFLEEDAD